MIYNRHKILIEVLRHQESKVLKIKLMKLLFLMNQESEIQNLTGFYDFVPYDYGPFSFTVYKDIAEMQRTGIIDQDNKYAEVKNLKGIANIKNLSDRILDSIKSILDEYGQMSQNKLIDYVYKKYPWYASRSKIRKSSMKNNKPNHIAVYTMGYEGYSIDRFLNYLLLKGIGAIIDVRSNPLSRKYGFSKSKLTELSDKFGIKYFHFPKLGIPSSYRANIKDFSKSDYLNLWELYKKKVKSTCTMETEEVRRIIRKTPAAVLCFEKNYQHCHRGILADFLSKETGLETIHI